MTVAWSFSRLENFELCPKWFYTVFVAKTTREEKHPAALYGQQVHEALHHAVEKRAPLPEQLKRLSGVTQLLAQFPGDRLCEFQMAVDESLSPVDWFGKTVYCRAIADFVAVGHERALLIDYKTGKRKDEFLQLELTACLLMSHRPQLQEVQLRFLYTSDRALVAPPGDAPLTREQVPWVLAKLEPRVRAYQEAHAKHEFEPRPSWKCRGCVVTKCPYAEARR